MAKLKRIDTFGNGEIIRFENPGDEAMLIVMAFRQDVVTKIGAVDIVDGIDAETGEPVAFFVTAGLKAYNWKELVGLKVLVRYLGEQVNPRSGRKFKAFDVFMVEDDDE